MTQYPRSALRYDRSSVPAKKTQQQPAVPQRRQLAEEQIRRQIAQEEAALRGHMGDDYDDEEEEYEVEYVQPIRQQRPRLRSTTNQQAVVPYQDEYGNFYVQPQIPQRQQQQQRQQMPQQKVKQTKHPMFYIGITLLSITLIVFLYFAVTTLAKNVHDTWMSGSGRVMVYHQVLTPGEAESCILSWNNNGAPVIIVYKACDMAQQGIDYTAASFTLGGGSPSTSVVTLNFTDLNRDGKMDIIVSLDTTTDVLWGTGNDKFSGQRPA